MSFSAASVAAELPPGADEAIAFPVDLVRAVVADHCLVFRAPP